jgi:hypothetical protein
MLGVTAERFPKGGAFALGLMGCVGNLAIALILPVMGNIYDRATLNTLPDDVRGQVVVNGQYDPDRLEALRTENPAVVNTAEIEGARQAFRKVSALPILLVVIFGTIAVMDRRRGGYKPEELQGKELAPAELASDY